MDSEPPIHFGVAAATRKSPLKKRRERVYFLRPELVAILNIYGKMVSAGAWKDYAIDQLSGKAVFSIHRRSGETPMYQIVKEPALAQKQGEWRIVGMNGQILKRGRSLIHLLGYFNAKLVRALN